MMEAYVEVEEEVVQENKSREMEEEERAEARVEPEQLDEESRKMKRGAEEAETKKRNERVRILITDKAFALMEKSLKDRFSQLKEDSTNSYPLFLKCLRRKDGNH